MASLSQVNDSTESCLGRVPRAGPQRDCDQLHAGSGPSPCSDAGTGRAVDSPDSLAPSSWRPWFAWFSFPLGKGPLLKSAFPSGHLFEQFRILCSDFLREK